MAQVDGFSFQVTGFEEVQRALRSVESDIMKKRELAKILRRQAKPALDGMRRNAPEIKADKNGKKRTIAYHRDTSVKYTPGNLKRSMKIFTRTKGMYPKVFVGAQSKKAKGSGYYGYFVQYGTTGDRAIKNSKDFRQITEDQVGTIIGTQLQDKTYAYIKKSFSREFYVE